MSGRHFQIEVVENGMAFCIREVYIFEGNAALCLCHAPVTGFVFTGLIHDGKYPFRTLVLRDHMKDPFAPGVVKKTVRPLLQVLESYSIGE